MSGRTLPTGLDTALAAAQVAPVFLVQLNWPGATMYLWNGYSDLTWGGQTWLGLGSLGSISAIKETGDLAANGAVLSMSGIPSALVVEALLDNSQGQTARIYFGVIAGGSFSVDPYLVFDGLIDVCAMQDDGKTATINIQLEKEMVDTRANARRYTDQDQQQLYPGDLGFQYTATLATQTLTWGRVAIAPSLPPGGGGDNNPNEHRE